MNLNIKRLLSLALTIVMLMLPLTACQQAAPAAPAPTDAPAPTAAPAATENAALAATHAPDGAAAAFPSTDFTMYKPDGTPLKLSDLAGQPIVLNFWATWCPPCRAELPDFQAAYETYGDRVTFVMLNVSESIETAQAFFAENGYTFPLYADLDDDASNAYVVTGIPTTIMYDAAGNILDSHIGMIDGNTLTEGINKLLAD